MYVPYKPSISNIYLPYKVFPHSESVVDGGAFIFGLRPLSRWNGGIRIESEESVETGLRVGLG